MTKIIIDMLVILTIRLFKWQIVCCDLLTCYFISILKFETPVYCLSINIKCDGNVLDLTLFLPTIPVPVICHS